ncbi:hypothetical protein COAQ111491_21455 [Comamonas aquatilis]|uniref:hypothetical protein n=1 Tax=Comamonas aquatilis TaxID=1778406 RepID=UPI0039F082C2
MLIKFKKPDPRAGLIARMDSSRGQQLIDAGAADQEAEGAAAGTATVESGQPTENTVQAQASSAGDQSVEAAKPKASRGRR